MLHRRGDHRRSACRCKRRKKPIPARHPCPLASPAGRNAARGVAQTWSG